MFAGNAGYSNSVDIFNVITGNWSTAVLSEARNNLAATSLPNQGLAIFAGGAGTSCDCHCDDCREACGVMGMWGGVGDAIVGGLRCGERVVMTHDLCSWQRYFQNCGHLQCDHGNLEQDKPQRGSICCCGHISTESRTRDLRWRSRYVV